jgi:hypothetical protein
MSENTETTTETTKPAETEKPKKVQLPPARAMEAKIGRAQENAAGLAAHLKDWTGETAALIRAKLEQAGTILLEAKTIAATIPDDFAAPKPPTKIAAPPLTVDKIKENLLNGIDTYSLSERLAKVETEVAAAGPVKLIEVLEDGKYARVQNSALARPLRVPLADLREIAPAAPTA